jgi:hypothetical protein
MHVKFTADQNGEARPKQRLTHHSYPKFNIQQNVLLSTVWPNTTASNICKSTGIAELCYPSNYQLKKVRPRHPIVERTALASRQASSSSP